MAETNADVSDLEDVIDKIEGLASDQEEVSIGDIQDEIGRRSFGPFLLVFGLIALTPVAGIPGFPTMFGIMVLLIAGQVLLGRQHFWMPGFVTHRSVKAERLRRSAGKARSVARWVDKLLRPRLVLLAQGTAAYVIAAICILLALVLPPLEVVPMGALVPSLAIAAFGLAMVANDGMFALAGYAAAVASLVIPIAVL